MKSSVSGAQKRKKKAVADYREAELMSKVPKVSSFLRAKTDTGSFMIETENMSTGTSFDYKSCLARLSTSYDNDEAVAKELEQMPPFLVPTHIDASSTIIPEHEYSNRLLAKYSSDVFSLYRAVESTPDGSCLFNSASILLMGKVLS